MPQHNHHNNRHNNAPGRNDHEQSAPDEQEVRQHDAGAFVVDPLRDIYRFTDEPHRDKLMSSFDGVRDMNDLIGVARNGMDLSDGQQVFVSYMGAQARNVSLREHLNWTALEGGEDADNPSEEIIKNVSDVLAAVREKEAEARTKGDKAEADRLKNQVLDLISYRQMLTADEVKTPGSKDADEVKVGEQYVKALKKAEYWKHKVVAPDEEKAVVFKEYEKAARALGERGDDFYTQAKAMEAILEHAGDKFAVEPDVADVQMDPRFEYKDTDRQVRNANRRRARLNAKQNPQPQQAPSNPPQTPRATNPRTPQNPPRQPQTPNVPPQNPGAYPPPPVPPNPNQQPPQGHNPNQQPPAPQGPTPGNMSPQRPPVGGVTPPQGPQGPGNQQPAGGGQPPQGGNRLTANNQRELEAANSQIERIREALAFEKSKMFRNSRFGRAAMRLVGSNYASRMDAMEDEYARLSQKKFGLENYGTTLSSNALIGKAATEIEAEQDKLREQTNEVMRRRVTAKFCKWLGSKKGIWATVGVGVGLAVFTPLGLAAGGIGLGMHMAAWHDRKTRGMRPAVERMPAEMARRHMVGRMAANANNPNFGGFFKEGMRYSMREFDKDVDREMYKRLGSVGIGLASAWGANTAASFGLNYLQGGSHEPVLDWMRANNNPWGL